MAPDLNTHLSELKTFPNNISSTSPGKRKERLATQYAFLLLCTHLSPNIGVRPADELLQLQQLDRQVDVILQIILRVEVELRRVVLVPLHVQANGSPAAAGSGQPHDDPASVVEFDVDTLVFADAAVEVRVREVVGFEHFPAAHGGSDEVGFLGGDESGEMGDHLVRAVSVYVFVIVTGEECPAVDAPEVLLDGGDAWGFVRLLFRDASDDVQPGHYCP